MGYTTYWNGELEITPPLSDKHFKQLERWLGMGSSWTCSDAITDDAVWQQMKLHDYSRYDTPWNPFDTLFTKDDHSATILGCSAETRWGGEVMEIIVYYLERWLHRRGYQLSGNLYWDGDEQEDLGYVCVQQREVWTCGASIVYPNPGDKNTEKFIPKKEEACSPSTTR